jgi:hypothetical protein
VNIVLFHQVHEDESAAMIDALILGICDVSDALTRETSAQVIERDYQFINYIMSIYFVLIIILITGTHRVFCLVSETVQ